MIFKDVLLAGSTLIREAIQSVNYAKGVAGWRIAQDGTAEFNNVTIRGGTQISGTSLYYDGTPGLHKLLLAISATNGTDIYGNTYLAGLSVYSNGILQATLGYGLGSFGGGGISTFLVSGGTQYYSSMEGSIIELGVFNHGYPNNPATIQYTHSGTITNSVVASSGIDSPSQKAATLGLTSESAIGAGDSRIGILADTVKLNGVDQGLGIVASANITSNVTFTSTETDVLTTPAFVWKAGRVYRVDMDFLFMSNTANGFANIQLRKGVTTTVTLWRSQMRIESLPGNNATNRAICLRVYLTPTVTFSSAMTMTATANGSTTGTISSNATASMSYLNVVDVGANTDFAAVPIS